MSELTDRIINDHLTQRPAARHAYSHDPIMHNEIERARGLLAVHGRLRAPHCPGQRHRAREARSKEGESRMTHRPYPDVDRARHQLDRHDDETPPYTEPRPMTPLERAVVDGAAAMVKAAQPGLELAATRLRAAFQPRPASSE